VITPELNDAHVIAAQLSMLLMARWLVESNVFPRRPFKICHLSHAGRDKVAFAKTLLHMRCQASYSCTRLLVPGAGYVHSPANVCSSAASAIAHVRHLSASANGTGYDRDAVDPRRRVSQSADRNKGPILQVLSQYIGVSKVKSCATERQHILEIASGTGQHVAHFASKLPQTRWQPTEWCGHAGLQFEAQNVEDICTSISAWTEGLDNVLSPIALDASASVWPAEVEPQDGLRRFMAIVAINVAHISPISAVEGLFAGGGRVLQLGGYLFLYGPFAVAGEPLGPGNQEFDAKLKARNCSWGLREVSDLIELATAANFELIAIEKMPADNLTLVFVLKA